MWLIEEWVVRYNTKETYNAVMLLDVLVSLWWKWRISAYTCVFLKTCCMELFKEHFIWQFGIEIISPSSHPHSHASTKTHTLTLSLHEHIYRWGGKGNAPLWIISCGISLFDVADPRSSLHSLALGSSSSCCALLWTPPISKCQPASTGRKSRMAGRGLRCMWCYVM